MDYIQEFFWEQCGRFQDTWNTFSEILLRVERWWEIGNMFCGVRTYTDIPISNPKIKDASTSPISICCDETNSEENCLEEEVGNVADDDEKILKTPIQAE